VNYLERKRAVCNGVNASHMWRLGMTPFKIDVTVLPESSAAITVEMEDNERIQFTEEQALALRDVLIELWPVQP